MRITLFTSIVAVLLIAPQSLPAASAEYRAGVATTVITPTEPIWIGGYGHRKEPADGKIHDLHAKVLVLEGPGGYQVALLTLDTENVPRAFADGVAADLADHFGFKREQVVVSCSHTHCGPALASADAKIIYPMNAEQYAATERYTHSLRRQLLETTAQALADLTPAELSVGVGQCGFGVNRRNNKEVEAGKEGFVPVGPVDHDVPVLRVMSEGRMKAVLFGYACHCTTLDFQKWCGDWAGFAKFAIEQKHPGTTALFMTGCGADTNPLPRRKLELAEKYGRQLAESVEKVLAEPMQPVRGRLNARFRHVDLAFESLPSRDALEQKAEQDNPYQQRWAKYLLARLADGPLSPTYAYPVQAIRLGNHVVMVIMGGEVVVDYSLRLKKELGPGTIVFAYSNDVCAYMPSERVLKEGGYEGRDAMVYYGHPSAWAPGLEDKIVNTVHELVRELRKD
ncbi:MAG TPA: neutral/alkaline non-lysosomal ceramidase N-terminal domain-containing protein [Phycisphaerae bacterium]|nr:neutral/alkaline non-lysosomal ceramidase N-terminal domain-containing protein [Phycisphaerae bacterium]HOJ74751.1 neutral/alkaline non-lysosomal ceramidase N-terminal domain-containing protein [Phycisphaerae bacterium]HOM52120.1 neutral/alkaline non-lysosomal ceramidase N-terminal domain-containing protein [Phycisphaerae bacterium]HON65902.1 neutral/alkaline non-lysosomal ceramidase N-terminal domain-containing protein [Phycisphaerae bacterium]HPP27647.1 neutral/alkaline non-lysosomal ceram